MAKLKQVHLTVQTLSGKFEGEFETDRKLDEVIEKTFRSLDIKPSPGDDWKLTYRDRILDPLTTIEENALPDRAVLLLEPAEAGGGRR